MSGRELRKREAETPAHGVEKRAKAVKIPKYDFCGACLRVGSHCGGSSSF